MASSRRVSGTDTMASRAGGSLTRGLVVTFGVILALFGFALVVVLQAMTRMEAAELEDARLDHAKHSGHHTEGLLREQYIHQAHTIIEWNRTHLDHYRDIARAAASAADALVVLARRPEDRARAQEIGRLVRKTDTDFITITVPAIDRNDHAEVLALHAEMEKSVVAAARAVRALNASFESQSDAARMLATHERSRVRTTAIGCFGAALLLAAIFGVVTTKRLSVRLTALREGARSFGDGELDARIAVDGQDELAEIGRAMNDMASRLATHQTALVRARRLASIGRFSAGVAHEINGPIGIILGYVNVIREHGVDGESLDAIEGEARNCQRIVQTLLDTSRPDTPRSDVVDLGQLARDAIERLRTTGRLEDRTVRLDASGKTLAFADESQLRQVVLNLLTNAVEATDHGGRIDVEVARRKGRCLLAVIDDGEGIQPSVREHLFEPFCTSKVSGVGLGLAISRAIVEAHRGELTLSANETRGTRAEVSLEELAEEAAA